MREEGLREREKKGEGGGLSKEEEGSEWKQETFEVNDALTKQESHPSGE